MIPMGNVSGVIAGRLAPDPEPLIRWDWLAHHTDDIAERLVQHLVLTSVAMTAGTIVAAFLTAIAIKWRSTIGPVTLLTTILYTIPSVALFAALIPMFGTGMTVPAIALTTYSLVVLTPFFIDVFRTLDQPTIAAANAMGMTRTQRFRLVELPLAMPGIISALRVAAVTVIGLVTVGGLFGLGGFGNLIDDGLTRDFPTPIVIGVVGSVALALVVDGGLWAIGRLTIPWNRPAKAVSGG